MYHLRKPSGFSGNHKRSGKLTMLLPVLLVICLLGLPAEAKYGGGTGQPNDPYLIYTAEQMNAIGADWKDWDKHFKLMADINLSTYAGTDFNIIGTGSTNAFSGVFDGNSKKISMYTSTNRDYTGLFGYLKGSEAEVKNLGLIDPNIDAGAGSCVGSLVGWVYEGTITNCYAEGSVTGTTDVGGLVGYSYDAKVSTSFWDIQTSGRSNMCGWQKWSTGCNNANGKTTAEMQSESMFLDAGWDFVAEGVNGTEDIFIGEGR